MDPSAGVQHTEDPCRTDSTAAEAQLLAAPGRACAFAQLSRSVTVRLNTSAPGFESIGSEMKYAVRSN